jgi:hypothetical protein
MFTILAIIGGVTVVSIVVSHVTSKATAGKIVAVAMQEHLQAKHAVETVNPASISPAVYAQARRIANIHPDRINPEIPKWAVEQAKKELAD